MADNEVIEWEDPELAERQPAGRTVIGWIGYATILSV
jgi:hypothetical protein